MMSTEPTSGQKRSRVLIAEDSATQALKLQLVLEDAGYEVTVAGDGVAAWEAAQASKPDLVISDIEMPRLDGYGLCRNIKAAAGLHDVPVILLTSLSEPRDVVRGLECGADNFLVKPYDERFLISRIEFMLEESGRRAGRQHGSDDGGIEIFLAGERHVLGAAPAIQTTVGLLLGTYETIYQKNDELRRAKTLVDQQAADLRQKNERMEADLRLAREIQNAFLPRQYPSFPHDVPPHESRLRFCHRWIPNATLGGDFFDVLALSENKAGVFICDVMGHGVRSALVTAMMRALVTERTAAATDPGLFLSEINSHLMNILQQTQTTMFASAFYLVADVGTGEMRYANAGHPGPLWVRRGEGSSTPTAELLISDEVASGPALGVFEGADYDTWTGLLAPHDLVVLFTDGLFEVENDHDEEYGEDRLLAAVRRFARMPADSLFTALLEDVQNFAGGSGFEDDVCLVAMEVAQVGESKLSDLTG